MDLLVLSAVCLSKGSSLCLAFTGAMFSESSLSPGTVNHRLGPRDPFSVFSLQSCGLTLFLVPRLRCQRTRVLASGLVTVESSGSALLCHFPYGCFSSAFLLIFLPLRCARPAAKPFSFAYASCCCFHALRMLLALTEQCAPVGDFAKEPSSIAYTKPVLLCIRYPWPPCSVPIILGCWEGGSSKGILQLLVATLCCLPCLLARGEALCYADGFPSTVEKPP